MAQMTMPELEKFIRGFFKTVVLWAREKRHGQIVITFRDGVIQLVTENHQRRPQDYVE